MNSRAHIDGVLVQWGDRLFFPSNRIVKPALTPRLSAGLSRQAETIRRRIVAHVSRRAPQVMVKVTGGGRGMGAIAAHLRYISKNGKLAIEDDRGVVRDGKEAVLDIAEQWRRSGARIEEVGHRREAYNLVLSMPAGTDAEIVRKAAREFAKTELAGHRYVMVLHQHQANPHVHLSVKAESMTGKRLNPRKSDLHRWRETFAEKLRGWGVEAEATRQATRGATQRFDPIWRVKAKAEGRLSEGEAPGKAGTRYQESRNGAAEAWAHIAQALSLSEEATDKALAKDIVKFLRESAYVREVAQRNGRDTTRGRNQGEMFRQPSTVSPEKTDWGISR
jgi:type IV secretory pathway VirD2 relaxase